MNTLFFYHFFIQNNIMLTNKINKHAVEYS